MLGGAALGLVFLALGAPGDAYAACSINGTIQTCTGLLGDGVVATSPIETLLINNVTGKVWPDNAGVNAIDFQSTGPITIISDTGKFDTIAVDADGIYADTTGGSITISHDGDIVSDGGYGVRTISLGGTSIIVDGDIESTLGGISARNDDAGSDLHIYHEGSIVASSGPGIDALSSSTAVNVYNYGDIESGGDGISAVATSFDNVYVSQSGDIDAGGRGIFASAAHGTVTVNSSGDFTSAGTGIHLLSSSSDATATHYGDVTSTNGYGIMVEAPDGGANLTGAGAISAYEDGIFVQSTGNNESATVIWTGDVTSQIGKGVYAYAANGFVTVETAGDISSYGDAIFAMTDSFDGATVEHTGNLTSADGNGVYAYAAGGAVMVTVENSVIDVAGYGILAQTKGSASDDDVTVEFDGTIAGSWIGIQAEATAGAVLVTSNGDITAWDHGIWAANTGSESVTVNQTGNISADSGHAIYAYTPNGAVTVTASGDLFQSGGTTIYAENKNNASVIVGVTGDIQSGGDGITALSAQGVVTVTMRGDIDANTNGIFAQSKASSTVTVDTIGDIDAGGDAIFANSSQGVVDVDSIGDLMAGGYGIYAVNLGNNVVTVNSTGDIDAGNRGIYAQSATGTVTVVTTGNVTSDSDAIFAQNEGSSTVTVTSIGDLSAGTNGDGIFAYSATGVVTVTSTGDMTADSDGIFARSTGASTVSVTSFGDISTDDGYGIYGYSATGAVTIMSTGTIWSGDHGIYALNLGDGTVSVTQSGDIYADGSGIRATSTSAIISVNNTGNIQAGGDGIYALTNGYNGVGIVNVGYIDADGYGIFGHSDAGSVTINNTGDIWSGSDGIRATTLSTELVTVTQVGDINASGYGVYVNALAGNADINTTGDITSVNHGIYALTNGDTLIDIDHDGDITSTTGYGIAATSIANGTIDVSVDGGTISGALDGIRVTSYGAMTVTVGEDASVTGTTGNAAVRFVDGLDLQLTNYGSISNTGGINQYAVVSAQNDTTVDNFGTISGNVLLGPWNNVFNNYEGGLFDMGGTVNIASGTLTNWGTLSPGGDDNVFTSALTGILVNDATGTLLFDVDMDNDTADRITVSDTASVDGDLQLNFVSADNDTPETYTIITTVNGVTQQSLTITNPFVLASVNTVNSGNDVQLSIDGFDFSPAGMGDNASSIGNAIQASIEGPGGLEPLAVALLNLGSVEEGENALNQLSPNIYVADQIAAVQDIDTFSDAMLSCRMAGGENAFAAEGECAWGRAVYSEYDLEATNGDLTGFNTRSTEIMGGVQMAIDGTPWRIGGSIGYRSSDRDGDGGASSEGDSFSAGAVVKYAPGPLLLAASLSASHGSYDTLRPIAFGNFTDLLSGETDVTTVSGRLRAAYTMQTGGFYLRPMVDASVTYVKTGAFTESGGIASVSTDGVDNTVLALMPAVEIGGQVELGGDILLRPYLRGGVGLYTGNDYALTGVFNADGNAATAFTIGTSSEDVLWTVSAGVDILKGDMGTLQIFYEGAFGQDTTINAGGAKFSVNF
ncbi:autotransporter outer membrane beta-barrel domain-containing protein [Aquibium sp. ELW1220]|uniref:autotransporter outer membrane beta-barrel domain-containing protein n=1 Tax=Aquibium sp. ELW1220 TaxID=2976766 RepID=UPI0025B0CC3A|nr:autotransporter outer membrane beta-barrel domain-containing protein [Aquibium sp. ELW1220]MDN2581716.1 autotransporter domain-containing protein [Aquibium sp. ELW1220]